MQALPRVSHEHHDRMWHFVEQLDTLADCMDCDCLDTARFVALLPELQAVHDGLTGTIIPHMDTVEAAVHPTLERLLAGRSETIPLVIEHAEIRRLVEALGGFIARHRVHAGRGDVLQLRRILLRLHALSKAHLAEEELYIPILEGWLNPAEEAALARALDHVVAERL